MPFPNLNFCQCGSGNVTSGLISQFIMDVITYPCWDWIIHFIARGPYVYIDSHYRDKRVIDQQLSSIDDLSVYEMFNPLGNADDIQPWPRQGDGMMPNTILATVYWQKWRLDQPRSMRWHVVRKNDAMLIRHGLEESKSLYVYSFVEYVPSRIFVWNINIYCSESNCMNYARDTI